MPLLKTWTEENGRWGIWQVTETLEELYACLSDDVVRQELERLKAPSRKMEYLAVRVLLKTMLGIEARIGHEPSGKPFLTGGEYHVSISHTKGYGQSVCMSLPSLALILKLMASGYGR